NASAASARWRPNLLCTASGGEVLVAAAGDVGVQSDRDRCNAPKPTRGVGDLLELLERFDVERANTGLHRRADLVFALAHAGEDDRFRGDADLQALGELAA